MNDIKISQHDAEHVGECLRSGTHWSARLLQLIAKSDVEHREALRRCFPTYVEAWEKWNRGDQP